MTEADMLKLARDAVTKIDRWPSGRVVFDVSAEEIVAMAGTLVCLGVTPWRPEPPKPTEGDDR
jgi:acyl-ACP thioesterase